MQYPRLTEYFNLQNYLLSGLDYMKSSFYNDKIPVTGFCSKAIS